MDYSVDFIYKATHPNPLKVPFHTHTCHEMVLYTKGEGTVQAENCCFKYKPNTIVVIPKNIRHNEINLSDSCNYVIGFHADSDLVPFGTFKANKYLLYTFSVMLQERVARDSFSERIIQLMLSRTLEALSVAYTPPPKTDFSFTLKNIDTYIQENIGLPISVNAFAEMYNYSPDRFRHIFKEKTGISPKQYIIQKRLERAGVLLTDSDKPIFQIAYECGFYDASQLSTLFRKHFGISPTEYRNDRTKR